MQTFEQLLDEWVETDKQLKRLAAKERSLRDSLVAAAFPNGNPGVNSRELADGRLLKATIKINTNVDQTAAAEAAAELTRRNHPEVFKVKYELAKKPYDALSDDLREIADRALTRKLGAPTLEVV